MSITCLCTIWGKLLQIVGSLFQVILSPVTGLAGKVENSVPAAAVRRRVSRPPIQLFPTPQRRWEARAHRGRGASRRHPGASGMNVHLPNRWAVLLFAAALLGGCAFRPQLHAVAIDHNRLVADSANELTLLNILRARDRQPMHFTSTNVLRGNAQVSLSGSVGAFIDEDGLQTISPSLGVEALSNPSFDIVIYDKQDFQNGIMRPVEPRLYQYFLWNGRAAAACRPSRSCNS
jgi:hypothetical protein